MAQFHVNSPGTAQLIDHRRNVNSKLPRYLVLLRHRGGTRPEEPTIPPSPKMERLSPKISPFPQEGPYLTRLELLERGFITLFALQEAPGIGRSELYPGRLL